jgi:hypothetical protein
MTILGQLPADQRSLPPDLAEAVKRLANYIEIDCGAGKQIASISDATAETMTVGEADESPTESLPRLALGLIIVFLSAGTAGVLWFRARRQ